MYTVYNFYGHAKYRVIITHAHIVITTMGFFLPLLLYVFSYESMTKWYEISYTYLDIN